MRKIPVWKTISEGYSFTFGQLGTIIGLIWLPMVIVAVAGYFVMVRTLAILLPAIEQGDMNAAGQAALIAMVWDVLMLFFLSMIFAEVTRQALGLRHGTALISFRFGATELRVFGAVVSLFVFFLVAMQAYQILIGYLIGSPQFQGSVPAGAAAGLITIVFLAALFFVMVRLSFFAVPATVSEGVVGLARSWQLTRGNFWRIVLIGLATLGPMVIVMIIAEFAILGPDLVPQNVAPGDANAQLHEFIAQMRAASPHMPLLYGFSFLIAPIVTGLALVPPAIAYLALKNGGDTK